MKSLRLILALFLTAPAWAQNVPGTYTPVVSYQTLASLNAVTCDPGAPLPTAAVWNDTTNNGTYLCTSHNIWAKIAGGGGGGGTPGGSSTAVQFNNSGNFGGDATNFFYNSSTHALNITGTMTAPTFVGNLTGNASGTAATITGSLVLANTPLTIQGDLLYANAVPALTRLPLGTSGQCLTSNGTTVVWGACGTVGAITGTGTAGTITAWTGASSAGNSLGPATDDGNTFTYNGNSGMASSTYASTSAGAMVMAGTEGSCAGSGTGQDVLCLGDSTSHTAQLSLNGNTTFMPLQVGSAINPQTATYQVLASDFTGYKTISVASGTFTITLVASGTQPPNGEYIQINNYGSGVVTIARSGQNINGGTSSLTLAAGSATNPTSITIFSNGTDYLTSGISGAGGSTPTLDAVLNPVANATFTFPATNLLTISGTAPVSGAGAGTNAGSQFSVTGTAGGATTGSATTGGTGSSPSIAAGAGGSGAGGTNAIGGAGGGISWTTGAGGASSGTAVNSNGGDFSFTSGVAGTGGSGTAGKSGNFLVTANNMTMGSGGALTVIGNMSSPVYTSTGSLVVNAAAGTSTATIRGGNIATTGGTSGNVVVNGGDASGTGGTTGGTATTRGGDVAGTGQNTGGTINIRGGNSGSTSNTVAVGGNVTITGGSCTAITTANACNGIVKFIQPFFTTGTATVHSLACVTATNTVATCTSSANGTNAIGWIDSVTSNTVFVQMAAMGQVVTGLALSATFTAGQWACADTATTAGDMVASATKCAAGLPGGVVLTTATTTTPVFITSQTQ